MLRKAFLVCTGALALACKEVARPTHRQRERPHERFGRRIKLYSQVKEANKWLRK
jgi:hypothetical protein